MGVYANSRDSSTELKLHDEELRYLSAAANLEFEEGWPPCVGECTFEQLVCGLVVYRTMWEQIPMPRRLELIKMASEDGRIFWA